MLGFATRFCDKNKIWNVVNVSECRSVEVTNILEDVEALSNGANVTLSDLTGITNGISEFLNSSDDPILPGDLQSTNQILNTVLR